jgi:hypothetical protein
VTAAPDEAARRLYEDDVLRFISGRLGAMGADEGGLYNYYAYRVEIGEGLLQYEQALLGYLADRERIFHAGIGIGTLTIALANAGVECVGFESDRKRFLAASEARAALLRQGGRYELRPAYFPYGLIRADDPARSTLLFTNVASSWDEAQTALAIEAIGWFGETILDLRLFGAVREGAAQAGLADRLRAAGLEPVPILTDLLDASYVRIVPRQTVAHRRLKQVRRRKPLWKRVLRLLRQGARRR